MVKKEGKGEKRQSPSQKREELVISATKSKTTTRRRKRIEKLPLSIRTEGKGKGGGGEGRLQFSIYNVRRKKERTLTHILRPGDKLRKGMSCKERREKRLPSTSQGRRGRERKNLALTFRIKETNTLHRGGEEKEKKGSHSI